jgi:hypothetical protein
MDVVGDSGTLGLLLEFLAIRALSDDQEVHLRQKGDKARRGIKQNVDPLLVFQPTDCDHYDAAGRNPQGGEVRWVNVCKALHIHGIGNDDRFSRIKAYRLFDEFSHASTDANVSVDEPVCPPIQAAMPTVTFFRNANSRNKMRHTSQSPGEATKQICMKKERVQDLRPKSAQLHCPAP